MEGLLGSLLEPPLLQLHLLLQPTPLHIGQQERLHQIPNQSLVIIKPPLITFKRLIHLLLPQIRHNTRLSIRRPLDGIIDNPVEVAVDSALIHLNDFLIETLLACPDDLLGVPATGLFNLTLPTFSLCLFNLLPYALLLSKPQQLLRQLVECLGNDLTLQALVHSVTEFLLVLLQQDLLGLVLRQVRDLGHDQQLLDESETLLLAFVHDVLLSTTTEDAL